MQSNRRLVLLGLAVVLAHAAGCARTQPTRYYTLSPVQPAAAASAPASALRIGVGPVVLPDYLDRAQMATMVGPNEVIYSEFHRWAEPLDAMLARVLAEDLALLIGTERIAAYPWRTDTHPDVAVELRVLRLEAGPDGTAVLDVRWRALTPDDEGTIQRTTIEVPAEPGDYAARAAACSRALADLGRRIADAVGAGAR
jgi:uncharacterized lipoprotein YmbA